MAEEDEEQDSKVNRPIPDLPNRFQPFVEVVCKCSGKTRRFAAGTEAGFAVSLINKKVEVGPIATHIEAVKEGEEPVSFGPNSVLLDYGDGWKLQTVTGVEGLRKKEFNGSATLHNESLREPKKFVAEEVINILEQQSGNKCRTSLKRSPSMWLHLLVVLKVKIYCNQEL